MNHIEYEVRVLEKNRAVLIDSILDNHMNEVIVVEMLEIKNWKFYS